MQKEIAVVTGGAGFIGTYLCRALEQEDFDVRSVDIKTGVDILDTDKLRQLFSGAKFVFHAAALPRGAWNERGDELHNRRRRFRGRW